MRLFKAHVTARRAPFIIRRGYNKEGVSHKKGGAFHNEGAQHNKEQASYNAANESVSLWRSFSYEGHAS